MLSSRAIALQGIGYSPALVAAQGFLAVDEDSTALPVATPDFSAPGSGRRWIERQRRRRRRRDEELHMLGVV